MWMQYMKPVELQVKKAIEKPSGARVEEWQTANTIDAAIFQESERIQMMKSSDVDMIQYDYVGITKADVSIDNRLLFNDKVLKIESVVPTKRYNQLFMKVIEDER